MHAIISLYTKTLSLARLLACLLIPRENPRDNACSSIQHEHNQPLPSKISETRTQLVHYSFPSPLPIFTTPPFTTNIFLSHIHSLPLKQPLQPLLPTLLLPTLRRIPLLPYIMSPHHLQENLIQGRRTNTKMLHAQPFPLFLQQHHQLANSASRALRRLRLSDILSCHSLI